MAKLVGTDDAGRGPVIGPMVLAGVLIDEKNLSKLENLDIKDSKLLKPVNSPEMGAKPWCINIGIFLFCRYS